MNRKDRRAAKKGTPAHQRLSPEQKLAGMIKNGITPDYVDRECDKAYNRGVNDGIDFAMRLCYAAALLGANDAFGFGHKRGNALLHAMDYHVVYSLTSDEAIDEVFRRMGLKINFKEPLDRIVEVQADV